jgi:Ca2+-binding RTX toxin-like protein
LNPSISVVGDTLLIEGTPHSDHFLIKAGRRSDEVRIVFNGTKPGSFGPIARIVGRAGDGDDVVVGREVGWPTRLEGGAGDDCLQGGGGPDQLFGEEGNDVLIGTRGRDALHRGHGSTKLSIFARRGSRSNGTTYAKVPQQIVHAGIG